MLTAVTERNGVEWNCCCQSVLVNGRGYIFSDNKMEVKHFVSADTKHCNLIGTK